MKVNTYEGIFHAFKSMQATLMILRMRRCVFLLKLSIDVDPQTVGVYTFHSAVIDSSTCATDVLIDPMHITPTGSQACIQVG